MLQYLCIPCQHGHHDAHTDVVSHSIEGLIGSGWYCPCRGGCQDTLRLTGEAAERASEILRRRGCIPPSS